MSDHYEFRISELQNQINELEDRINLALEVLKDKTPCEFKGECGADVCENCIDGMKVDDAIKILEEP